jgi:hypothetical protein
MNKEPAKFILSTFLDRLEIPAKRQRTFVFQILLLFVVVVGILFFEPSGFSPDVVEGQICQKTLRSPRNISFSDERKTNELRRLEEEKIEPVLAHIENSEQEVMARFDRFMGQANAFYVAFKDRAEMEGATENVIASYFAASDRLLDPSELKEFIALPRPEFDLLKNSSRKILQNLGQKVITSKNLENVRNEVKNQVGDFPFSGLGNRLVTEMVRNSLKVNSIEDEKLTRQRREAAGRSVTPVKRSFQKGQKIIDEGVTITEDDLYVLRTIEKQIHKNRVLTLLGNILLTGVLIIISILHLQTTRPAILKDPDLFRLMGALWIGALLLGKGVYSLGSAYDQTSLPVLLSPLPAIGLLMALLLDFQVAIFHQMLLGVLMFVVAEANARWAIVSLLGGVIGILVSDFPFMHGNIRASIGWSGVKIGAVNVISMLSLLMLDAENFSLMNLHSISILLICGMGNGILSGILANGVLPYIENFFALATGSKLLELADLSQPLLKKLAEEAPGTYQHSMMVAALAEAAAIEIKADALLAKIGGYYHDIGKLKRPSYFSENQKNKNQHDQLTPYMSSLILVGHIRDGADLGREFGIPERVISFIAQHHGTTLISYFYEQAKTDTDGQEVNQERFRYPGPKPQSKEAAVVMLADSVEAAARTLPQHTHARIEALVKKIVENKLTDENQLDESDLTLKDIEKIEQTFVKVIGSMYHGRVDYPGKLSNQTKGGADGSTSKQPAKEG